MTKITAPVLKPTNGGASKGENAVLAAAKTVLNPDEIKTEEQKPLLKVEPEKPIVPAPEPVKEMTLMNVTIMTQLKFFDFFRNKCKGWSILFKVRHYDNYYLCSINRSK